MGKSHDHQAGQSLIAALGNITTLRINNDLEHDAFLCGVLLGNDPFGTFVSYLRENFARERGHDEVVTPILKSLAQEIAEKVASFDDTTTWKELFAAIQDLLRQWTRRHDSMLDSEPADGDNVYDPDAWDLAFSILEHLYTTFRRNGFKPTKSPEPLAKHLVAIQQEWRQLADTK